MEKVSTVALVIGFSTLAACGGFAIARIHGATSPAQPVPSSESSGTKTPRPAHVSNRFAGEFDLNHDGIVTKDEVEKVDADRFAAVAGPGRTVTQDQYVAYRGKTSLDRLSKAFHRLDWNGDGKLSLDEYAAPLRAKFASMDRDGTGFESCTAAAVPAGRHGVRRGRSGRSRFCAQYDLNRDGRVTHAEFDTVILKRFAALAGPAKFATVEQYASEALNRDRSANLRAFKRLDADGDGHLSLEEFSQQDLKTFGRLDRNGDGEVTREELSRTSAVTRRASNRPG